MMKDELMHTRGIIEMYQRLVPDTSQTLQAVASRAMAELEAVELQLAAAAQQERELREGLRDIINGNYDNARTIDAVERYARRLLASADGMQGDGGGEG